MNKVSLRLYLAGSAHDATIGLDKLKRFCTEKARAAYEYELEIINVLENPQLAFQEGIIATPTLVRVSPPPQRLILGDLADRDTLLSMLQK
ncbi:MAG: circadian clock protein KaiB [Candidatus Competibacteraceae bacterium]|nr:circadian clock protein KaiB [Candidatus Competibacteraceae bacterium]